MAKFLFQGSYIGDGLSGLIREGGTPRIDAARQLFASLGGMLECFYFAFGTEDLVVICDLPDNVSALAFSLAINSSGMAKGHVTVLATVEEVDAAVRLTPQYRAPCQGLTVRTPGRDRHIPKNRQVRTSARLHADNLVCRVTKG